MRSLIQRSKVEPEATAPVDPAQALRAPLDELLAVADLLQRQPLSPDGRAQCEALLAAARTLQSAMAAMVGEASAPLALETVSLQELVDEIDDLWQARTAHLPRGLMLSRQFEIDHLVHIDAAGFRRTLDSLIGAALEGAEQGVVEATLKAEVSGDRVRIEAVLHDTGPAFANPRGESPALSACRRWVAASGGQLAVEAAAGSGRRIVLAFHAPIACIQAEPAEPEPAAQAEPRVLIVDDNATNRMVAEALCGLFGFVSEAACDGQEALDAVRQRDFDLILMDIRMPRLDGVEATRAIRALPGAAGRTPIVALTANADAADVEAYLAVGMCAVVEKPIKPDRLLHAVSQALNPEPSAAAAEPHEERSAA